MTKKPAKKAAPKKAAAAKKAAPKKAAAAKKAAPKKAAAAKKAAPKKAAAAKKAAPKEPRVALTVEDGALDVKAAKKLALSVDAMLEVLGLDAAEVSLALVGDDTIQGLNKTWRKKNKPTDVLSFPLLAIATREIVEAERAVAASGARLMLGDVVISVPTAGRQAKERGRALADELVTLAAHGVLHLLCFDHPNDDDEREMNAFAAVLEAAAHNARPLRLRLAAR
jgi:probable rRNA maturation factor